MGAIRKYFNELTKQDQLDSSRTIFTSYLERRELPTLKLLKSINLENLKSQMELGYWIGIDYKIPLSEVMDVNAQGLEEGQQKTKELIKDSSDYLISEFNEDEEDIEEMEVFDLDWEQVFSLYEEKKGSIPHTCYPIYFITVGSGDMEKLVYIGKTSSSNHRFKNGHKVALKLHAPKYNGLSKNVYFGCIVFYYNKSYIPIEWMDSTEEAKMVLDKIEQSLIKWFDPELNEKKTKNLNVPFSVNIHIQNFKDNILNDSFIAI